MVNAFIKKYESTIDGVISCFDRVVIKGTLPSISYADGMAGLLYRKEVQQIVIHDLAGKIIYQGSKSELNNLNKYRHSHLLVSYFDNLGNKLCTKKHFSKYL